MPDTEAEDQSMVTVDGEDNEGTIEAVIPQLEMDESQDKYFASYEDVEIHRLMVNDKPRTKAYANAISKNKHLFAGKVVMDVGAGTGILSLFMAAAGAKVVYAVEASGMAKVIEKVASDNGFADVIKVFHAKVEDITLPANQKVDVIVSEWMGFYLLHESMLNSVINARNRFLSEDGTVFPSEARIYACPCSVPTLFREQIDFWNDVYNFNMSAVRELALKSTMVKPEVCLVPKSDLLAEPVLVKTFHLRWVSEQEIKTFTETSFVGITRAGLYQGLCLWFECDFDGRDYDEEGKEFGALVTLSTSPSSPPTHWKQTVVILGYGMDGPSPQEDFSNPESDEDDQGFSTKEDDIDKKDLQGAVALSGSSSSQVDFKLNNELPGNKDNQEINQANHNYEVDEDEVIGWRLIFAQSSEDVRHHTMTVEMLDPETEEHPIPCSCPMPRCLIIAKMMEGDVEEDDDAIDCT